MTWVATGTAALTAAEIAAAEAAAVAAAQALAAEAATAAATTAATEAAVPAAITSVAPTAATTVAPTGIAAVPEAAAVIPEAATPMVPAAEAPAGISQVANVPSNVMTDVGVNPDYTAWQNAIDAKQYVPQDNTLLNAMQNANAPTTPTASNLPSTSWQAPSAPTPQYSGTGINPTVSSTPSPLSTPAPAQNSFMQGFTQFADKNPFMTAVLGYTGLNALGAFNMGNSSAPAGPTYAKSPTLSANFQGGPYTQPNVYKPRYAAGGITAAGPVEQMGESNQNMYYPQGQQIHTQFATPSQMPTSAEVVRSDYEPKTDPYSRQVMASGGIAGYRGGGKPDSAVPEVFTEMMDPNAKYRTMDNSSSISGKGIVSDDDPDTRYADALTATLTRQGKIDKRANFAGNTMKKPVPPGTLNFTAPGMKEAASGGIMGYSLGGYAAGGNPRLLKGPGDGMSDNIPATIGNRQPARLADGEFVVPADVVSHLGNGSTNAGAKKLHGMMDKVRMDRTGKKKQAPAVNPNKYMPKK
jgi:hypothetical protein